MLQKVLKVSNAEHNMFYEKEAGADFRNFRKGVWARWLNLTSHDNIKKLRNAEN